MKRTTIAIVILGCCLAGLSPCLGAEVKEEGHARITPWSGYWWPHFQGLLLKPLAKYDQLTGKQAEAWERKVHAPGADVPRWHGYCHAWAASSLMEKEPAQTRVAEGSQGQAKLGVGDQKGLLAACHALDVANSYGDRFGDEEGSEDKQDLRPDVLWRLLKLYVKQQGVPLILDIEAGAEVWNYPIYAYRIEARPAGDAGWNTAKLTLWMADDAVPPDYVGVKVRRQSYQFSVQLRNNSVVMGTGRWLGPSVEDHPDFAWYPFVAVAENPEVEYTAVQRLLGASQAPPEPQPETEPQPPPTTPADPDNPTSPSTPPTPGGEPITNVFALSPLELVALIAEQTSAFALDATVDRFDGGEYKVGDGIQVRVSSEQAGYLYLLHVDSKGTVALLFPQSGEDNRIAAKQSRSIPGPDDKYVIRAALPLGTARIKAVVTSRPLVLSGLLPEELVAATQSAPTQQRQANKPAAAKKQDEKAQNNRKADEQVRPRQVALFQSFRWHPTQRRQIQRLMQQYQRNQQLKPEQSGQVDLQAILGSFAQDEVAYYVGPNKNLPKQNQDAQKPRATPTR